MEIGETALTLCEYGRILGVKVCLVAVGIWLPYDVRLGADGTRYEPYISYSLIL